MGRQHQWGLGSKSHIGTLEVPWPEVLDKLLWSCPFDLMVVYGHRGKLAQDRAYAEGRSTKKWPDSLHNQLPSIAVDIAPYVNGAPDWGERDHGRRYYIVAGLLFAIVDDYPGYELRWGGDWDQDGDLDDQTFIDLGHFELRRKENGEDHAE